MQGIAYFAMLVLLLICCGSVAIAASERNQKGWVTTFLYIALIILFYFGGTGIMYMFD